MDKSTQPVLAFQTLNYLLGDVLAATNVSILFNSPFFEQRATDDTRQITNHMCLSHLFLTLCKCCEFYERFRSTIPDDCLDAFKKMVKEIDQRGIRQFRNKFVGHIWDKKNNRPLTNEEIDAAISIILKDGQEAFFKWCNHHTQNEFPSTVVSILQHTRNRIKEVDEAS